MNKTSQGPSVHQTMPSWHRPERTRGAAAKERTEELTSQGSAFRSPSLRRRWADANLQDPKGEPESQASQPKRRTTEQRDLTSTKCSANDGKGEGDKSVACPSEELHTDGSKNAATVTATGEPVSSLEKKWRARIVWEDSEDE